MFMRCTDLCRTAVWAFCLAGIAQAALTSCDVQTLVPPIVTPLPSVLVGDMRVQCITYPPAAPITHTVDVMLFANTNMTSNVIAPDGSLETVLLINDPAVRIPGVNTFYAKPHPVLAQGVVWDDVPLTFTTDHLTTLHITNIRLNTTPLQPLGPLPGSVVGFLSIAHFGVVPLNNPQQIIAYVQIFQTNVPEPAALPLTACALLLGWCMTRRR